MHINTHSEGKCGHAFIHLYTYVLIILPVEYSLIKPNFCSFGSAITKEARVVDSNPTGRAEFAFPG